MDETQELDRLNAWLNVALRKTALAFEDGRREDDAMLPSGHEDKSGLRLKRAVKRMERTILPLLDEFDAKVREMRPSAMQLFESGPAIDRLLDGMAENIRHLVRYVDGIGGDAGAQVERRIASLRADVRNHLAAANPSAAKAMPLSFVPQSLAAISPSIEIEEAAHRLCGNSRVDDVDLWIKQSDAKATFHMTVQGNELPPEECAEQLKRFQVAVNLIHEALGSATLHAHVWSSKQGIPFGVPRFYWKQRPPHSIFGGFGDAMSIAGGDESMMGKPMLALAEFETWLKSARMEFKQQCPDEPVIAPAIRMREPSVKRSQLGDFVRWADSQASAPFARFGKGFFQAYESWCKKRGQEPYGRSQFHEELKKIRSSSAIASANDDHNR